MSSETPKLNFDDFINAVFNRVEKYGIATVLLLLLIYWAKPHADELIRSHSKLIEKTVEVQAKQAETLDTATKTLDRVDHTTRETNNFVRELKAKPN